MKPTKKYVKIKKYKSKKHKRKFIGGRDKNPIQILGTTYARPDMKSFDTNDPIIIEDMKRTCDKVTDQNTLLEKLYNYPYFKITQPMNLVLFPYCNEQIKQKQLVSEKFADKVDLVNKPLLDPISMDAFKTAFGPKFSFDKTNVKEEDGFVISDPTNTNKFIVFLQNYVEQNLSKKGIFIVSHSGFMTNLIMEMLKMKQQYNGEDFGAPDLYTDIHEQNSNIAFDNLDMIHIQYDTENKLFLNITIRRKRYEYNIDPTRQQTDAKEPTETNITKKEIASEDECKILNIFIMRHCLACHNLSSSLIKKASQYVFNRKGYLNYSLCLRKTCFDLLEVKKHLLDLFRTYCFFNQPTIRLSEIVFGSSVIFRAVLTCSLVFNSLTRQDSTVEEIERLADTSDYESRSEPLPREPSSPKTPPPSEKALRKRPINFPPLPSTSQPSSLSSRLSPPLNISQVDKTLKKKSMSQQQRQLPHTGLPAERDKYEGDTGAGVGIPHPEQNGGSKRLKKKLHRQTHKKKQKK
jgi:hypothetical protein